MHRPAGSSARLAAFNDLPVDAAVAELLTCCYCHEWAHTLAAARPYRDLASLTAAAREGIERLDWAGIEEAMAAHPRIGQRPAGDGREAGLSRREQSGAAGATPELHDALVTGNHRYEERFGHVFLIRASGRDGTEMLAELRRRLANHPDTERAEVREQLAQITVGRLTGALS